MIPTPKLIAWMAAAMLLTTACKQELYERGDAATSYLRADFVEAYVNGDKRVDYVITDDGDSVALKTPYQGTWIERSDTVYRALMYYNYGGTTAEAAETKSMSRVPVLSVKRDAVGTSKWKTDPVGLETIWLSRTKKYLNLGLLLKTGEADVEKPQPHTLSVVNRGVRVNKDSTCTAFIALSHWQGDMPEYYTQRTYLSVAVDGLEVDSLHITLNTYNGEVTRAFRLRQK